MANTRTRASGANAEFYGLQTVRLGRFLLCSSLGVLELFSRGRGSWIWGLNLFRNIYYKDPALFKSQRVVDRYIDILAYSLGVQRAALNVVSILVPLFPARFCVLQKPRSAAVSLIFLFFS